MDGATPPSSSNPIYALSSNDNPNTSITHVVLKGSNYEEWAIAFRLSLCAKRKLSFINGTLKQPSITSSGVEDWWIVNSMIVAWTFNTIDSSLRSSISYRNVARYLWEDIRQRFSVGNGVKIYQLKSEISDCKQKSAESIMSFYGRIKKLWDDMNNFDPVLSCSCTDCRFVLTTQLRQRREGDHVREFLMGLEQFYANVRSSLLSIEPLPSLNIVYARLIQEEEVRTITGSHREGTNPMSFAVRGSLPQGHESGGAARPSSTSIFCNFCHRSGHSEDRCYAKHGYLEGWVDRQCDAGRGRGNVAAPASPAAGSSEAPKLGVHQPETNADS